MATFVLIHGAGSDGWYWHLVAQSMAGFTAPIVADRLPCKAIIMVCAMVPSPGESAADWWANTGQPEAQAKLTEELGLPGGDFDPLVTFLHDVPDDVVRESEAHVVRQSGLPALHSPAELARRLLAYEQGL
jgi:hypothetical protein